MGLAREIMKAKGAVVNTRTQIGVDREASPTWRYADRAPLRVIAVQMHTYQGVTRLPGEQYDIDPLWLPKYQAEDLVQVIEELPSPNWWWAPGRILAAEPNAPHNPRALAAREQSLKIIQGCGYDPGNAAYRFHTALNETTDHASAFVRYGDSNPFTSLRQWDGAKDNKTVRALLLDADVVHCHVDYLLPRNAGLGNRPKPGQLLIRHYHGSMPKGKQWPEVHAFLDDMLGALLVGARLTLCAVRPDRIQWLPIAVPAQRYWAMRTRPDIAFAPPRTSFRIAHSPTRHDYKGTGEFLDACERLRSRGLDIEPVLIEGKSHRVALEMKATADAVFDSFWLGIQGSGLEGGAMHLPVIAGDPDVAALYRETVGHVPYTYANDGKALEQAIERLATDRAFYQDERDRVRQYVLDFHDYPAVARIYEGILSTALDRTIATAPEAT